MYPGEAITSYDPERQPNKKFLIFIIAGVVVFVAIIGIIAFMLGGGQKMLAGIPSIDKEKFENFKNYIYYGKTDIDDPAKIEDSTDMYLYKLTEGNSYLNYYSETLSSLNKNEYVTKLKSLYEDLGIDTEKYQNYKEYDEAIRLLAIYIDPISYYRETIKTVQANFDVKTISSSISETFKVDENYTTWSILADNLESYFKKAANLYVFYYQNGCARGGTYDEQCIQKKGTSVINNFNKAQTQLQTTAYSTFSDSTRKTVTDRVYKLIEILEDSAK